MSQYQHLTIKERESIDNRSELILNLRFGDKVLCPFTDSEFQRGKINGISKNFFACTLFLGVSENGEKYSKKSPQIRSEKNEFVSFERLWYYSIPGG